MDGGVDLDALFGPTPIGGVGAGSCPEDAPGGTGLASAAAPPQGAPHPALRLRVGSLLDECCGRTLQELRECRGACPASPHTSGEGRSGDEGPDRGNGGQARKRAAVAGGTALADRLERAVTLFTAQQWLACGAEAVAARELAWGQFSHASGWPSVCVREAFMAAELLSSATLAAAGDTAGALLAADHVFVFASPGPFREAAALAVRLLGDAAQAARQPSQHAGLQFPSQLPDWAAAVPSGLRRPGAEAQQVQRVAAGAEVPAGAFTEGFPFVAAGAADSWPARQGWRQLSSFDVLTGGRLVPTEVGSSVGGEGWREELTSLGAFIGSHLAPSCKLFAEGRGADHGQVPAYLAQHELLEQCPGLKSDIEVPSAWRQALGHPSRSNVWIGTHGTVTPCHWDSYENCLAQVQGFKRVMLLPPTSTNALHVDGGEGGGTSAQGNVSPVDLERPDLERFPRFAKAAAVQVAELGPGDALYIPRGWWHQVRALTPSISVNHWF